LRVAQSDSDIQDVIDWEIRTRNRLWHFLQTLNQRKFICQEVRNRTTGKWFPDGWYPLNSLEKMHEQQKFWWNEILERITKCP
jgi:hypothetical protein